MYVVQGYDQLVTLLHSSSIPSSILSSSAPSSLEAARHLATSSTSDSPIVAVNDEIQKFIHYIREHEADKTLLRYILGDDYRDDFRLFTRGTENDFKMKEILIDFKKKTKGSKSDLLDIVIDFCDRSLSEQDRKLQRREAISILLFTSLYTEPTHEFDFDIVRDINIGSKGAYFSIGEIKSSASSAGKAKKRLLRNLLFLEHGLSVIRPDIDKNNIIKQGIIYLPSSERSKKINGITDGEITVQYTFT